MSDAARIRASDAERDQAAEAMREHYAAGRLTAEELSERLDAIYEARTVSELAHLRGERPGEPPAVAPRAPSGASTAWLICTAPPSARWPAAPSATGARRTSRASCPCASASRCSWTPTVSPRRRCSPTGTRTVSAPTGW